MLVSRATQRLRRKVRRLKFVFLRIIVPIIAALPGRSRLSPRIIVVILNPIL